MTGLKRLVCLLIVLVFALPSAALAFVAPEREDQSWNASKPDILNEAMLMAQSAILIEAESGEVIFEKNADAVMYPASTTKILTTLLALMMGDLEEKVTVSENATILPDGYETAKLQAGEIVTLEDLLYATMVISANDAAQAVAEHISGSIPAFADLMNTTAAVFGCENTHFTNPAGIQDEAHYTTARDMAIIAREAMNNPDFRQLCRTTSYPMAKTNMSRSRSLSSNNYFINQSEKRASNYYLPGTGIKTGFTEAAGYCYVGSASKGGVSLISVVFYSGDNGRFIDTQMLMEYGFSQYVATDPMELYQMNPITVETAGFSLKDSNLGRLQLNIKPKDDAADATIVVTKAQQEAMARQLRQVTLVEYTRDFNCPITYGEEVGTLTYFTNSGEAVEYVLTASRSIAKNEDAPKTIEQIEAETYADPNPFPPITLEFVLLSLSPLIGLFIVIRLLRRLFRGKRIKAGEVPKPQSRYFR